MSLFVDTSVWSLAFRRDTQRGESEVGVLVHALETGETVLTSGIVLQELLQVFFGPKNHQAIIERFSAPASRS